jgi:hypothetical protein
MCISPCGSTSVCATNEKCVANLHKASCQCKHKLVINAAGELTCPGGANICSSDSACPQQLACVNQVCQSPCHSQSCPKGKSCHVLNHKAICMCSKECESEASICLKDRGCPRDMACINFKCQNPCEGYTCQGNTPCVVENHKAVCKFCPPGFVTDTNYGCLEAVGCRSNNDCADKQSCVKRECVNPCEAKICGRSERCSVEQHLAKCLPIEASECEYDGTCFADPCDPNPCGAGAKCENDIGNAVCSCPTGKAGDPLVRCSKLFYHFNTFLVFPKSWSTVFL